jgi:hypothetical protein
MKRVIRRPSPAMVVAIVALIAALGGTAIGAAFVTKKQSKKIAKNQVNKLAPGLSVASAKSADNATNATSANSAKNVLFASVDYNDSTPAVVSGTPGIVGNGEAFLGAPRLTFPRDTTNCAVTASVASGGPDGMVRWSGPPPQGVSDATNVVVNIADPAGASVRLDYSIVVVCPA